LEALLGLAIYRIVSAIGKSIGAWLMGLGRIHITAGVAQLEIARDMMNASRAGGSFMAALSGGISFGIGGAKDLAIGIGLYYTGAVLFWLSEFLGAAGDKALETVKKIPKFGGGSDKPTLPG
jgi:hypothetical protein